jgi:hypothetical protein
MTDPFSHDILVDGTTSGNQFILATICGVIMALICALVWMVAAFTMGPDLDGFAVGVGVVIGLTVRLSGKGTSPVYGILGMILTLVASVSGNVLGVIASGTGSDFDILAVAQKVNLPDLIMSILTKATTETYVLFGAGVVFAFLISVRR